MGRDFLPKVNFYRFEGSAHTCHISLICLYCKFPMFLKKKSLTSPSPGHPLCILHVLDVTYARLLKRKPIGERSHP